MTNDRGVNVSPASQPHRPERNPSGVLNDSESMTVLLSHLSADRVNLEPLHMQLSNALEQAIFSGQIPEHSALPSVRVLAERIGVSTNTVVRSYRKLTEDGWLRAEPKRGYFVTLGSEEVIQIASETGADIRTLIDDVVATAQEANIPIELFMRWVRASFKEHRSHERNVVAVVGFEEAFLDQRVEVVAQAIADLPFEARALAVSELDDSLEELNFGEPDVAIYVVPVGQVRRVAFALGPEATRILPMTRRLRDDVRDAITLQPAWTRFGIVSGSRLTAGRIRAALVRLRPTNVPPRTALTSESKDAIDALIDWADIVVIGTTARLYLRTRGYPSKPTIEMAYLPDDHTLRTLRQRLEILKTGFRENNRERPLELQHG